MARLEIALLGPLHLTRDGQAVTDLRYDKVRALLAYLAVEADRPQRRETLAALLWPEQSDATARTNLRRALLTLRAAIGDQQAQPPFLLISRDTLQFNRSSDYTLDVASFQALLAACDAHTHPPGQLCRQCVSQLEQAVGLYRGDFLAQFGLRDSVGFSEWALVMRERLHRQALGALTRLVAYHEQQGADTAAQQYARRLLELEPWDEAAHRCLMRVFARQGRRNTALAQYQHCRQVLAEELAIEPVAETTALYRAIQAGAQEKAVGGARDAHASASLDLYAGDSAPEVPRSTASSTPASQGTSPMPVNSQAVALAHCPDGEVLLLADPLCGGGIRFGLMIAKTPAGDIADGVRFVVLTPVRDRALVAVAQAQVAGCPETGDRALAAHLQEYMRDRALRLVLDNFERVLHDLAVFDG